MFSWYDTIHKFPAIIEPVLTKYNLKCKVIFEREAIFYGNGFVITGCLEIEEGVTLSYLRKKDDNSYYKYNIESYFNTLIDDKDRNDIRIENAENKWIRQMILITNSMMNKWDNMLSGKLDWVEDFKKSRWYYVYERPFQNNSFDMAYKRALDEMENE